MVDKMLDSALRAVRQMEGKKHEEMPSRVLLRARQHDAH